jgi:tetratricopeptide (TPR) repeat protein
MSQWRDIFGIKIKKPNFLAHLKSINLNSLDKILFAVLRLSLLVLALVFILMIASWVIEEDSSIVLVPFDTAGLSGNLNGNSMSNFLQYEIQTIKDITRLDDRRSPKFITGPLKVVSKSCYNINYTLNNVGLSIDMPKMEFYIKDIDKDLDESLSDIGTINVEGTSFSIGKMLLSMKELAGHKARTISCSIQNYGSTVSVTAIFHDGKSEGEVYVWEAKRHLMEPNQTVNDQIPSLIEDLAFQITYNLGKIGSSKPETYPRNWTTFKDLVLAREAYETYSVNEKIIYLDKASNLVLQANESEPDYKGSIRQSILYDLGFAYLNEGKYNESGRLFRSLFAIEPEIGYFGLGLVYYKNNNYEKALSYINRVTVMNPKNAYAWLIKGIILNSEKNYADAQESLNKSNEDFEQLIYRNLYIL